MLFPFIKCEWSSAVCRVLFVTMVMYFVQNMHMNVCRSYAKGFGMMGALFSGSECVIEKFRAKHDMYNSIYAGCSAGAILAHSGGPKAMCVGCASFAAFSYMIDRFMGI